MFLWIVIVLVCAIILEEGCEVAYKRTKAYKESLGGCDRFRDVPDNLEIANIGSGPGLFAISYDYCEKKGFNFATAPQNYKYGFRLLKRFHEKIREGAVILIIIMSPMSFGRNNDYDRKDYNDKFYGILPKEEIDHYSWLRALIASHPFAVKVLRKAKQIIKSDRGHVNSVQPNIVNEPLVIETWKKEFELDNLKDASQGENHKEAFQEKIEILQAGLNYCYDHKWTPVFVIPPIPEETRRYISDDFLEIFVYQNIRVLTERNPNLRILDYFDNEFPISFFMNDIFMNQEGQKEFSKRLFRDVDNVLNTTSN